MTKTTKGTLIVIIAFFVFAFLVRDVSAADDVQKKSSIGPHLSRQEQLEFKQKWHDQYIELEKIVNEWDPVGLISAGAPDDEYDCLSTQILFLLHENKNVDEIRSFILAELDGHFGYGINNVRKEYRETYLNKCNSAASKIMDWYKGIK